MISFGEFLAESEVGVTSDAVAGVDAQPFKTMKIAGCDCIEVDADTYMRCKFGKRPYAKWSGYVEDEALRDFIKTRYNKSKRLMISVAGSGVSTFLRR